MRVIASPSGRRPDRVGEPTRLLVLDAAVAHEHDAVAGIGDKAAAVPGVLSGGQRQRLAIARALANEPTLLLADEPTGALDSEGGHEVIELMRRLHRGGQTIILVTHDADVAAAAERVVRMRDGRIVDAEPAIGEGAVIGAR